MNLSIINMQGELQLLDLNYAQSIVHSKLELQRRAGLPMRAIILKARREGVSTYIAGRFFREINRRPMRFATVCSVDTDATQKVFKMSSLFQEKIPGDISLKTKYSGRNEIVVLLTIFTPLSSPFGRRPRSSLAVPSRRFPTTLRR